jgi:hypothetical protein
MKLIWFQRPDGLWNADCTCGASCCGIVLGERAECEAWHFQKTDEDRKNGNKYYAGGFDGVEVHYAMHELRFSTYCLGSAIPDVARLAMIAWQRWGGEVSADPEVRRVVYKDTHP